jgi:hypothetical protein
MSQLITINDGVHLVKDFHLAQRVSPDSVVSPLHPDEPLTRTLGHISTMLKALSQRLEHHYLHHPAGLRPHLTLEETAEWIDALIDGDEERALDALADRLYVLFGDAATYDLPLEAAFAEVHWSNMTKEKQPDDPSAARVRAKGPNYVPPNLRKVLDDYRQEQHERGVRQANDEG